MKDTASRFWSKAKHSKGCWVWTACANRGYGAFNIKGKMRGAHRVSYEIEYGPIPSGMLVCHTCDNKLCVRPSHLFLGTQTDNKYDSMSKDRHSRGERVNTSKLTKDEVKSIRIDKRIHRIIAAEYNVDTSTIRDIKYKRTWKHV